jgi:glycosyltransferase involved in cell wall biosynthesis
MKVAILSPYPTLPFHDTLECREISYENNATWTVVLADALAKMPDLDVHVVTEAEDISASKQIRRGNVTLHFIRAPRQFKTLTFWQFDRLRLHRALDEIRPDIVHGQGIESQYGYVAVTSRYPCLLTIHGLAQLSNRVLDLPWLSRPRLVELFESFCLKKARDIVVINPFIAEYLRLSPERYRLFLIPNPVAEQFFEKSSVAREPGLLLSIGWVDRLKAHDVLLRALALLRQRGVEARAVIAGPLLPGEYLRALQRYINDEHLNVEFTNFLAPEQLADRLRRCVVLVQPSRHDNSPMSVCEAMACGTPVVAARVGGIGHLIRDGETGLLFESANCTELADRLEALLSDDDYRARLGRAAARHARDTFEPGRIAQQTRAAYDAVLQRNGHTGITRCAELAAN